MQQIKDMTHGELTYYNWHRVQYLQHHFPKDESGEQERRLAMHKSNDIEGIRRSLTTDLVIIVDAFIAQFSSPPSSNYDGREEGEC